MYFSLFLSACTNIAKQWTGNEAQHKTADGFKIPAMIWLFLFRFLSGRNDPA